MTQAAVPVAADTFMLWAGLAEPYGVALMVFPLLVARRASVSGAALLIGLVAIMASPWLVDADHRLHRFLVAISSSTVAVKVVDAWLDARFRAAPTWRQYVAFVANPFTHVRRWLPFERVHSKRESLVRLVSQATTSVIGGLLLALSFGVDWRGLPFIVEHAAKTAAFMVTVCCGVTALAALWRLAGARARDVMDAPLLARTPADFWRRYNRNMQQFFWRDLFGVAGGRRSPARAFMLVFGVSALLHEFIFFAAIGRVQGYQLAFFAVQGVAAMLTARVEPKGRAAIAWVAATLVFNLVSSMLFFASIHAVVPFYSVDLPDGLRGWLLAGG